MSLWSSSWGLRDWPPVANRKGGHASSSKSLSATVRRPRKKLNEAIHRVFQEKQVYRIDHYLGKETVQNILMFRFANAIYEPIWNHKYIDQVQITAAESAGVEHRAGYYERSGVLRDMFQNHLFQLMSLVAMEPPASFDADAVRDEKAKVMASLCGIDCAKNPDIAVRGQYTEGSMEGETVPAYRKEAGGQPAIDDRHVRGFKG